jgi:alpha,alpha-trehalase
VASQFQGVLVSNHPIADYALLSDCHSAALVSRTGSVDWLCLPRFDSPSIFGRLLDPQAGHWYVRPTGQCSITRQYVEETLVLETTFTTATGKAILRDAMAIG